MKTRPHDFLATMLVRAVEETCIELGIEIFACQIEDWNTTSMAIFDHLGYTATTTSSTSQSVFAPMCRDPLNLAHRP
jgi:hypothetical protein